jgi:tetratricopeptide (TPR) repeat protein
VSQSDFVTRGQALVSSGQYQEAVKVCRLGLLGRPTTVEGRVVLGQALLALKRYDEVLAEMRVALELDHGSHAAQALKGEAMLRKGDGHGAIEALAQLRSLGVADAHVLELLAEAERLASRSPPGNANRPAVGFPAQDPDEFAAEPGTRNYPAHQVDGPEADAEDSAGEYTRPTSLAAPGARKRSSPGSAPQSPDVTPPPAVLAVGDRSGTVEVDPELEGFELPGREDDFGEVVGPPVARRDADPATGVLEGARSSVSLSTRSPRSQAAAVAAVAKKSRRASMFKEEVSTVELGDDEVIELDEPRTSEAPSKAGARKPGPGTAVRNAVKMPSGPLDAPIVASAAASAAASRPTAMPMPVQPPPPQLAQRIANQPHVMNVASAAAPPQVSPRSAIAAALPTAAAMPMPAMPMPAMNPPMGMGPPMQPPAHLAQTMLAQPSPAFQQLQQLPSHMQSNLAAVRPTVALNPQQQQSAAAVDALFNGQNGPGQGPAWARAGAMPAAPGGYGGDPQGAAMNGSGGVPVVGFAGEPSSAPSKPVRSGRKRSRLQFLVWVMIGAAVIGGGVFAGFQIRAMRLRHQIIAARDRAGDLARADTWQGWLGARDSLYSIAQASPTLDNRAALARARGVLAFELGDGLADARAAVDGLGGQGGLDLDLATAYVALAQRDARVAHDAAERALREAPGDAAALYVSGQAALLAGDLKAGIAALRTAVEREPRPHHAVALARALGDSSAWDEALAMADRVRDNPGAVIARAALLAGAGRIAPGAGGTGAEIRAQLTKLIADAGKPGEAARPGDQAVSPAQVAYADLALARVDFARGELGAARSDYLASLAVGFDDQRFFEELCDTVLAIGELDAARKAAGRTLEHWPASRRARITLAQIWLALGKPATAIELFATPADAAAGPAGQTVRGQARLATGDVDGARADFDGALKKLPGYEPALVARTWLDLSAGDVDGARKRIEPRFNPKAATSAMIAVYAAILRATGDAAARDKARAMLERAAAGAPGPDTARAQLELARIDRDAGDLNGARAAYAEASRGGNFEARLESGLLLIDSGDPRGGRETLEQLYKDAGEHPSAALLLETARARTLMGEHAGAFALLAAADQAPGVVRWQLDRERGRLALHKGDTGGAAQVLDRALDACGGDLDTFLLVADTVSADDKQLRLAQKLRALMPARLKGAPELDVIEGKLHLAANQYDDAEKVYIAARDALDRAKASPRRHAQAYFGLAATAYYRRDDATALSNLKTVFYKDPSIDAAYLFAAEIDRPKDPTGALKNAQQAVAFNPDSLEGWRMIGTIAAQLGYRKLLDQAITRAGDLAPGSDALHQLQRLK